MGDYIATVHLYSYGAWDDAVAEHNYAFEHEPLVTTFEATKEEVRAAFRISDRVDLRDLDMNRFFCDPFLSISTHVVVMKKFITVKNSIAAPAASSASGGGVVPPQAGQSRKRTADDKPKSTSQRGGTLTDAAFKGVFQRMMKAQEGDSQFWTIEKNLDSFQTHRQTYMEAVTDGAFAPDLSLAPFHKLVILCKENGHKDLLVNVDQFIEKYSKDSQKKGGKAPGGQNKPFRPRNSRSGGPSPEQLGCRADNGHG